MAVGMWFTFGIIIVIVFIVLKAVMKKQAIVTKLAFFIFIFLMLTVGYVYTVSGIKIHSSQDVFTFGGVYFSWFGSMLDNVKTATAHAVKQDWGVKNETKNIRR